MRTLIICFLFLASTLLADPARETLLTSQIAESVNPISGDFSFTVTDYIVHGVEPLPIQRTYSSGKGPAAIAGWELFFPHAKIHLLPSRIKDKEPKHYERLVATEPWGQSAIYRRHSDKIHYTLNFAKDGKGITNTAKLPISAKTNLKNSQFIRQGEHQILQLSCSGTQRIYQRGAPETSGELTFYLRKENLPNGNTIHYEYDIYSRPTRVHTSPSGTLTSYTYDPCKHPTTKTISYQGKILSCETFRHDPFGHLLQRSDPEGSTTTFTYDSAARKTSEEKNREKTTYTYNPLGHLHTTREESLATITERDLLGRILEERKEDLSGFVLAKTAYSYDSAANLHTTTTYTAETPRTETTHYDPYKRPQKQIDPWGHTTTISYQESDHLEKITTDPLGLQTQETYDPLNRLITLEKKTEITHYKESRQYNPLGSCTQKQIQIYDPSGQPLRTYTIATQYDSRNRPILIDEEGKITRTSYTPQGQIATITKPDNIILTYSYNPLGHLHHLSSSDKSIDYTYSYNRLGQLLTAQDRQATTERQLDPQGRLLQETLANHLTIKNLYDKRGRRLTLQLPDATTIHYSYDALYLRAVTYQEKTHRYTAYDLSGHLLEEELVDNLGPIHATLDPLGRLASLTSPYGTQQIESYDLRGDILQVHWQDEEITSYSYDILRQLTSEQGPFSHTYSYDSLYNRLSKDNIPYTHSPRNELLEADTAALTYDPNGNPLTKTTPQGTTHYRYDALDRLVQVTTPDHQVEFSYDPLHRRTHKTSYIRYKESWHKEKSQQFLYDGDNEIGSCDENGNLLELRVLGSTSHAERGTAVLILIDGELFIPLHDLQGNIAQLISCKTRAPSETHRYSAFGESDPLGRCPWRYSSKRYDSETGLTYFGRRYYDPQVGRWLTPDPRGFEEGLNLYAFVLNDPLVRFDLYGLKGEELNSFDKLDKLMFTMAQAMLIPMPRVPTFSVPYTAGTTNLINGGIGFINGINNSLEEAREHALRLSQLGHGTKVHGVYNATHTAPIDILECIGGRCGIRTPPVQLLKNQWNHFVSTHGSNAKFLQICHSGGAIHVFNALSSSSRDVRDRIIVLAISPGAIVPRQLCYEAYNYASKRDFVPKLDVVGNMRYGKQLTLLEPHKDARSHDHAFDSPTFHGVIKNTVEDYLTQYGDNK